jgi:hypothetical protein
MTITMVALKKERKKEKFQNRHFSKEDIQVGIGYMKKMLSVINYQGNANQNQTEILP